MTENKLQFLNNIQSSNDLVRFVQYCVPQRIRNASVYNITTSVNVNKNNRRVSPASILSLYQKTYQLMFQYVRDLKVRSTTTEHFRILKQMYENGKLKPNLSPEECQHFFFEVCPKVLGEYAPLHAQSGENPHLSNGQIATDFIHIYPFEYVKTINCRLYLNTTPDNSCKIGEYLLEECFKRKLRVYFKFDTEGARNDSMLIYTNYDRVNDFIQILEKIKTAHPELFDGAVKSGVLTAKVNDFISYGEEPEYKHTSFNAERSEAIEEYIDNEVRKARINLGNYTGTFQTRTGDVLHLREYLIYRLKASFLETLQQTQDNIKKGIFPKRINQANVRDYIEIETNIYNACMRQIPDFVLQNIEANVDKIIVDLKRGLKPVAGRIDFRTQRTSLSMYNPDYAKSVLQKQGYLPYHVAIKLDIQEKLFNMFNITSQIQKNITLETLEPYFSKHHCSVLYPHLNTETAKELNSGVNV